jgi:proteasome assembly chaperone (PAC2) family protein
MYEHIRFVIEKLTAKMRNDISLNPEELEKFSKSIEAIIADATDDEQSSSSQESSESIESTPELSTRW